MHGLKLVIGSKNGSSWSLRPWLLLQQLGLAFEEIADPAAPARHGARGSAAIRPAARCRCCSRASLRIWDSLAIAEYLAEREPSLWPADPARAGVRPLGRARDAQRLRRLAHLPADGFHRPLRAAGQAAGRRWRPTSTGSSRSGPTAGASTARAGPFLFGSFTIADAMFAPVCSRFTTYAVPLEPQPRRPMSTHMMGLPAMLEWGRGAAADASDAEIAAPVESAEVEPRPERLPDAVAAGDRSKAAARAPDRRGRAPSRSLPPAARAGRRSTVAPRAGTTGAVAGSTATARRLAPRRRGRAAGRAAPGAAADPVDDHGQAHRGRNSATTLT